jgi:hypothetical protein
MRKVKRYEEGGDVEYETQDSEGNDINPDEMYSSTIDRNAQRLIAENEKKSMGNAGNKAVTRVSKTTRIEPIIPEDRASEEEVANKKSYESKGVGVGSSDVAKRGMTTRSAEAKERGAKTLEEGLPSALPIGRGLKYAKGALDELRTVNAAKQLAGPSSQKLLSGPSSTKLLSGPASETKLLTGSVAKSTPEYTPPSAVLRGKKLAEAEKDALSTKYGNEFGARQGDRLSKLRKAQKEAPTNERWSSRHVKPEDMMKRGGSVSSASSRGDGIAQRGKTRGRMY